MTVRQLEFSFLNRQETEIYLDLLQGDRISELTSATSYYNLYTQFDHHLNKSMLPLLANQIRNQAYSLDLYNFNIDHKILDVSHLAAKYIQYTKTTHAEHPPATDDIFWDKVFSLLNLEKPHNIWIIAGQLSLEILQKHLKKSAPIYDLKSLQWCITNHTLHPNILMFVQHNLASWMNRHPYGY